MSYDGSIHRCDLCDKIFVSKSSLKAHCVTKNHKNKINDNLIVSDEQLTINSGYLRESYCEPCDKNFTDKGKLKRHNGTEKHRKNFELFQLKKNITISSINNSLSINVKNELGKNEPIEPIEPIEEIDELNLKCNICGKFYSSKSKLKTHLDTKLHKNNLSSGLKKNIKNDIDINIENLECKVCNKIFSDRAGLKKHCDSKSHKDNSMKSILLNISDKKILIEQPISKYKCEVCDISFGDTNGLKNHYMCRSHIEKAENSDIICNLPYKSRSGAVALSQKNIDGNFILKCEICDNSHVNIFALTNHYKTDLHKRNLEKRDLLEASKLKNDDELFLIHMTNKKKEIVGNTKVDKNTYINVIKHTVYLNDGYVQISVDSKSHKLSRYVYYNLQGKIPNPDKKIDHANNDPLDNRLENLREATDSENARNKLKAFSATSKYYGVCLDKNKWVCFLKHNGINHNFRYDDELHAAYHHDLLIKKLNLQDFSKLNNIKEPLNFKLKTHFKKIGNLPRGIYSCGKKFCISFSGKYVHGFNTVDEASIFRFNKINEQIIIKQKIILAEPILRNNLGIAIIHIFNKNKEMVATTLVDDDIYYKLKTYSICYDGKYALIMNNGKLDKLSRFIMNYTGKDYIDHEDSNKLNNQKYNLRILDKKGNGQNKSSVKNSSSKYVGVSYRKKNNKWLASIKTNGKSINLGSFKTENEAVIPRDKKVIELNKSGNYFKLNLPETSLLSLDI